MHEPDVALTDFFIALECASFAWLLARAQGQPRARPAVALFIALASGSLCGGLTHGFFHLDGSLAHDVLWRVTLASVAAASVALALECAPGRLARKAIVVAYALLVAVMMGPRPQFIVAIIGYVPPALAFLVIRAKRWVAGRARADLLGAFGMLLNFVASGLQIGRLGLHPRYFDHNALYHLVEAGALGLLFVFFRSPRTGPSSALTN